ncbi:MAG: hypothetical protein MJB14_06210 [Spirochaetes bacterium]|nr:hypothetical protein [Spirochaetota bacterium]
MKARNNIIIGLVILIIIIGVAVFYQYGMGGTKKQVHIKGYVGGEKMNFLENEKIQNILKKKYGVVLDYAKAGSIEMVKGQIAPDIDFLWPSSQVALELFKKEQSGMVKSEIIFNSPIVLYTWDKITEALIKEGYVVKVDNVYLLMDFPAYINDVINGRTWKDIGVDELYGKMTIISTDPSKSNSGNMFSGLIANVLHGEVVDSATIQTVLPDVKNFFSRLGYMEHSSSDLFEQYLRTGMGAKPIIAGYESQIIEFSIQNANFWPRVKDKINVIYPVPTVWSSHPVIILNKNASVLIEALVDEEIQKIAWKEHGFRTGLMGVQNDLSEVEVPGIIETVSKVIPMPSPEVMDEIINAVGNP